MSEPVVADAAPQPTPAERLDEVWLQPTAQRQFSSFLRIFELSAATHMNREYLVQEQLFLQISDARSLKLSPAQITAFYSVLQSIFQLFEDPSLTRAEVQTQLESAVQTHCVAPLFSAGETSKVLDHLKSKFVGAKFSMLQLALCLSEAEIQARLEAQKAKEAEVAAAAAAAAAEAAAAEAPATA